MLELTLDTMTPIDPGEAALKRPGSGYVLKFISGKYQGGEFPLELDTELIIGRSSDLDMVLVEDMVSRQHSRITTHGGELYIEDLGSTNGTFVNGEKVSKKRLKEGDRILVGTSIIKLVAASDEDGGGTSPNIRDLPDNAYQTPQSMPAVASTRHGGTTITGSISGLIDEVPLPDLLQLFSTSKKSGVLVINSQHNAELFLRDGRLVYCRTSNSPDISPYKAFSRTLSWVSGTFSLEHPSAQIFPEEMEASTEALLMEGMRQLDEIANLGPSVPALGQTLSIKKPLVPPLRALTPELLDTMQLVHNCVHVEVVLNTSLASDFETFQDLVYLLQNDYIQAS